MDGYVVEVPPSRRAAHAAPARLSARGNPHRSAVPGALLPYTAMTCGAVADCGAFAMSRANVTGAAPLYWLGQVALVLPCIVVCLRRSALPTSRLLALQLLAGLQALLAWAYSPDRFRFPDELQHVRTAHNILATGHLFTANPALPVSPGFPSLEIVTTAVSQLAGIPLFAAGVITASITHVLLVTAVFAWAGSLRLGPRRSATCALAFGFTPDYPYFDTLFIYSAIALPFFVLVARAAVRSVTRRESVLLVIPPLLVAVVSHHLTGYLACAFLALVAVAVALDRRDTMLSARLAVVAIGGMAAASIWTAAFAPHALDYLLTPTRAALDAVLSPHAAGAGDAAVQGLGPPLWQRLVGIAGSLVVLTTALGGAVKLSRSGAAPWLRLLSWGALTYPAVLVVRVVAADGPEISSRLLAYAMLLTCLPVAVVLVGLWGDGTSRRRVAGALAVATVIAAGSTVAATPQSWQRLPGAFHVAAYESGIDTRVAAAAGFGDRAFFPGSTVACDLSLCSLVAGGSRATTSSGAAPMFFADTDILRNGEISRLALDYVMIDDRMALQRPDAGIYFPGESDSGPYPHPYPAPRLATFATDPQYSRLYDNGDVQVYDVSAVWNG